METLNITNELQFKTSRSGGNGGQNVNKTETKVEVLFYVAQSNILNTEQKELILLKYAQKINSQGALSCYSQATRSQLSNKEIAIKQMNALVNKAFVKKKMRKPTSIPKAIKEKILGNKKLRGETKQLRQKVRL